LEEGMRSCLFKGGGSHYCSNEDRLLSSDGRHCGQKVFKPQTTTVCIDLGVTCLKDLDVDKHTNNESWDSLGDFESVIAKVINNRLKSDIQSAAWYSVVMDEATDASNEQSVIVYVKVVVNRELKTHFLELVELKGCKAHDIFTTACKVNAGLTGGGGLWGLQPRGPQFRGARNSGAPLSAMYVQQ
jgi:hypothetical protein